MDDNNAWVRRSKSAEGTIRDLQRYSSPFTWNNRFKCLKKTETDESCGIHNQCPLTPGGDLMKAVNSEIHEKSGKTLHVKPASTTLTLDSLAAISGRTNEVNRNFTIGVGTED